MPVRPLRGSSRRVRDGGLEALEGVEPAGDSGQAAAVKTERAGSVEDGWRSRVQRAEKIGEDEVVGVCAAQKATTRRHRQHEHPAALTYRLRLVGSRRERTGKP